MLIQLNIDAGVWKRIINQAKPAETYSELFTRLLNTAEAAIATPDDALNASAPCDDEYDVISQPGEGVTGEWVARCCHGITSQGTGRAHAVAMTLEACAIAHESVPFARAMKKLDAVEQRLSELEVKGK